MAGRTFIRISSNDFLQVNEYSLNGTQKYMYLFVFTVLAKIPLHISNNINHII